VEYIGVTSVPLLVLVFALYHSDYKQWLTPGRIVLLSLIPAATVILAWTNEFHGLIWSTYSPYFENGIMFSQKTYGIWFWIYWVYSYLLLISATVLIVRSALVSSNMFRWQAVVLVVGILFPWAGNLIYVLKISPFANLDLTPLAFGVTSIMLALGIVRWGLFDLKPVAQSTVLANMSDGLVVLDGQFRLVEINPSAAAILHTSSTNAIGKPADRVLPAPFYNAITGERKDVKNGIQVELKQGDQERFYEISYRPILGRSGVLNGSVITLHDQTEYKRMEYRLLEAELRESREALDESETKFRLILEEMGDAYFEVDLNGNFTFVNKSICDVVGFPRQSLIGMNYRSITAPDYVRTVYEAYNQVYLEQRDNAIISYYIVNKDGEPRYVEVMASLLRNRSGRIAGFRCVGRDISERKKAEETLEKSNVALKKALDDAISTLVKIVEMRDPYTAGHQQGVANLAVAIAREMDLSTVEVQQLYNAAVVHDIGKIYVPAEILSKPGKLTDVEFEMIKTHSRGGYDILKGIDFPCSVAQSILQHHERMDGSGYPDGLKGDAILLQARILAVADVVDAMASHRPYRPARGINAALEELNSNRCKLYDPAVVDACLRLFKDKNFKLH
jgi:PAS domain S-box-containing protein